MAIAEARLCPDAGGSLGHGQAVASKAPSRCFHKMSCRSPRSRRVKAMARPLPKTPDQWLKEILLAIKDAKEAKPFARLTRTKLTDADLFHLAPLVCLKFRGRKLAGAEADRVTKVPWPIMWSTLTIQGCNRSRRWPSPCATSPPMSFLISWTSRLALTSWPTARSIYRSELHATEKNHDHSENPRQAHP